MRILILSTFFLILDGVAFSGENQIISKDSLGSVSHSRLVKSLADPDSLERLVKDCLPASLRHWASMSLDEDAAIVVLSPEWTPLDDQTSQRLRKLDAVLNRQIDSLKETLEPARTVFEKNQSVIAAYLDSIRVSTTAKSTQYFSTLVSEFQRVNESLRNSMSVNEGKRVDLSSRRDSIRKSLQSLFVEGTSLSSYILHKIKASSFFFDSEHWSDSLHSVRKILLVVIGEKNDPMKAHFSIQQQPSYLYDNITSLWKLISRTRLVGIPDTALDRRTIPCRFVELNPLEVVPPCIVHVSLQNRDSLAFCIREWSHVRGLVGMGSAFLDRRQVQFQNGQLGISIDTAHEREWKQHLVIGFDISFFGHDWSNYEPLWSCATWGAGFWRGLWNATFDRLGIFAGMNLSTDPLGQLYLGLSLSVTKEISALGGFSWTNQLQTGVTNIGEINSFAGLEDFFKRRYSEPKFFWGIALTPQSMLSTLGMK